LNWIVVAWFVMTMITLMQLGAMFGGVAQVLNLLIPAVSVPVWVVLLLVLTLFLLLGGGYERIEGIAVVKVALFTLLTLLSALLLTRMPQYFSWVEIQTACGRFVTRRRGLRHRRRRRIRIVYVSVLVRRKRLCAFCWQI
jgi:hypothetical protein